MGQTQKIQCLCNESTGGKRANRPEETFEVKMAKNDPKLMTHKKRRSRKLREHQTEKKNYKNCT